MLQTLLFDTAFGRCRIGWEAAGVRLLRLPGPANEEDRGAGQGEAPGPPAAVVDAMDRLRLYFLGEAVTFGDVALDLGGLSEPHRRVYRAAREIGWGETVTYGELARRAGLRGAARLVGQAMAANPVPIIVPCHRVLAAGGRLGGFSAFGGAVTKERLLILERTRLPI